MHSRPSEPTSALAALIAGNHRHVERRAAGADRWADDGLAIVHAFPRKPFALAVAGAEHSVVTPHIFSLGHDDVIVVDALQEVGAHASAHGVKLIVVIQPIQAQFVQANSAWMHAELRAFSLIETILRDNAAVRRAATAGDLRLVAALLEHPTERVHWVGEHPECDALLQGC
jgi:hypothetical protein